MLLNDIKINYKLKIFETLTLRYDSKVKILSILFILNYNKININNTNSYYYPKIISITNI